MTLERTRRIDLEAWLLAALEGATGGEVLEAPELELEDDLEDVGAFKVGRGVLRDDGDHGHPVICRRTGETVAELVVQRWQYGRSRFRISGLGGWFYKRTEALEELARYRAGRWCATCPHARVCNTRRACDTTPAGRRSS